MGLCCGIISKVGGAKLSLVNDYLKSQLKRLDKLFQNTPQARQACIDLNHSFKDSNNQILELYRQIETYEMDFNVAEIENIKRMHLEYTDKELLTKQTIQFSDQQYLDNKRSISDRAKSNAQSVERQLGELFKQQHDYLNKVKQDILYLESTLKKENKALLLKQKDYQGVYLDKLSRLHEQQYSNLYRINHTYHDALKDIHRRNKERLEDSALNIKELKHQYEQYFEFHKNDLVYIRQNFHRIQTQLNTKINEVDQNYRKLFQNTDKELLQRQKNIEVVLESMHDENLQKARNINNILERKLTRTDERLDHLKQVYEKRLRNLTQHYQKDITQINIERLKQKRIFNDEVKQLNDHYHQQLNDLPETDRLLKQIEKKYDKESNHLNKRINTYNDKIDKAILNREQRYFNDRLHLGYEFIRKQEMFRYYRFIQDNKKTNLLEVNKLTFKKYEAYMNKLNTLFHLEKDKKNTIIDTGIKIELLPIDIQILLARHIHDLEINYLNLEQNYTKANHDRLMRLEGLNTGYEEFNINNERDKLNLIHAYETKQNEIDSYLLMEYEKNTLEGHKRVLKAAKAINEIKHQIEVMYKEHEKEIYLERQAYHIDQLRTNLRIQNERLQLEDAYQKELNKYEKERAQRELQKETSILQANEVINTSIIENTRFQKVLSNYFLMLQTIQTELERISYALKDAYLSSFNNSFQTTLYTLKDILLAQKNYKDSILDEIKRDTSSKIQSKIDELTLLKYEKEHKKLLDDYEAEKKSIIEQRYQLNDQIKALRRESLDLYTQIAEIENKNDTTEKTITFTQGQIKVLRMDKDKQSRKTAKNLSVTVSAYKKEIAKNEDEINHIRLKIEQIKARIQYINKGYKPLDDMMLNLERHKEITLNQLKENQYAEGRVYYENLKALDAIIKEFSSYNKAFIMSLDPLFNKLSNTSLTQKEFHALYDQFSLKVNQQRKINQSMHKRLSRLLDKQHFTVRNEQQRIINEFNKNYQTAMTHLTKSHKQELRKILNNEQELVSYQKSLINLSKHKLKKSIDLYQEKHKNELKSVFLQRSEKINQKNTIEQEVMDLLKATSLNREQVLLSSEQNLKQDLKRFERNKNRADREKRKAIEALNTLIIESDISYEKTLIYYAQVDKQERQRFNRTLHARKRQNENDIIKLNKDITKIQSKAKRSEIKVKRQMKHIERIAHRKRKRMVRIEKFKLFFSIKRSKKRFKSVLQQEKNTFV